MTLYRDPGIQKKCKFGTHTLMLCIQEEEKEAGDCVLHRG